jgi:sugar phosphate isomerase/epimerase
MSWYNAVNDMDNKVNRRFFFRTGVLGAAAVGLGPLPCVAAVTKREEDPFHGLKVGMTSYTLRKYNLDEAIAKTKQAGVKYFSIKEVHLPLKSTPEERKAAAKKITDAGLVLMGGGVIYMKNDAAQIRNVFEYAKDLGMKTIVCSPDPEALDEIEKRVKEYDLFIAIHNHGPTDKKYPSPMDVLRMVEKRDSRMGACIDVGHTVRIGEDPVEAIQKCAKRLYEFHMKDVTSATPSGKPTEVGKGVIDIAAVLRELVKMKWPYHVALEYEANGDDPMPGVVESYAYMRGALAGIG